MRAAIIMAVVYALCVLMAPIAVAAIEGAPAPHGLTDNHHATAAMHIHADGAAHHHSDQSAPCSPSDHDDNGHTANCCGLLCLTALGVDVGAVFGHDVRGATSMPVVAASLAGRGPDRLNRPPIALLPI